MGDQMAPPSIGMPEWKLLFVLHRVWPSCMRKGLFRYLELLHCCIQVLYIFNVCKIIQVSAKCLYLQAMFNEFSTANIQIDKDFSAKLSGYGCINHIPETEIRNSSVVSALILLKTRILLYFNTFLYWYFRLPLISFLSHALIQALANVSVETLERGVLTPKSNVWCFGIVLLELLTGRKNLDSRHPKEEMNLVKWSRPFLADDCRLSLIMDPQLKGRFPAKAARTMADVAQRCLHKDPSERPTMRIVLDHLKTIQDLKYSCRFPLQEPGAITGKNMSRSSSLNLIIMPTPKSSFSPSPPTGPSIAPTRPIALPMSLHPRTCSSNITFEGIDRQESQKSSPLMLRRAGVEGFWLVIDSILFLGLSRVFWLVLHGT